MNEFRVSVTNGDFQKARELLRQLTLPTERLRAVECGLFEQ